MRKIAGIAALIILFYPSVSHSEDAHKLEKIVVTPSRLTTYLSESSRSVTILDEETFSYSDYNAIPDIIGNVGGIDMRRRGPNGVQADINIRGATFEQNTVLIDGVNINDPQTGHYSMDLPVTMMDVDRIEILKGPASNLYGANSFGGVINIVTKKPEGKQVLINAGGGSYDYVDGGFSVSYPIGPVNNRFSFEESRSSGYMPETEFNILSLMDTARVNTPAGDYDFVFGYTKKDFGAGSFYSNLYPNEEEHTDTRFFKLGGSADSGALKIRPKLFLRRHWDKFALDRNRPGWQTNYHTTYSYGGELGFIMTDPFMDASYGFELSRDTIDSTSLQTHSRTKDGIYLELSPHLAEGLYINGGARIDRFSGFGWECSPSVSVSYTILKDVTLRGLVGRSYRIPTFTDLYYNDSANIGNPDLRPESSWTYEAGADYRKGPVYCSATFFHRNSYDTIDWTRMNSGLPWRASNIGSVDTNGFEMALDISPKKISASIPVEKVFFSYTAVDSYRKHDYLSKYALDYLKQQISAGAELKASGFSNYWVLNYKKRIGDSGSVIVDTKVSKEVIKKGALKFEAFIEISNIFDTAYSEQSGIPMPGRWIKSGAHLEF
ncbi:MAG: TonB-dependent receptor [Candidatus Omnitrophota bacterium]